MINSFKFGLLFFSSLLILSACNNDDDDHDHDDHNEITITFLAPSPDQVIPMSEANAVVISIEVEASDENHEVEIELHPESDTGDKIIDDDEHTHDKVFKYDHVVDLSSYPSGTEFHLEVTACLDHNCEETTSSDIEFKIE